MRAELIERPERSRPRDRAERVGDRLGMLVQRQPLADHLQHRLPHVRGHVGLAVGRDEAVDAPFPQALRERVPARQARGVVVRRPGHTRVL